RSHSVSRGPGRWVAEPELEASPRAGNAGIEVQDRAAQPEPKEPLDPGAIHPACGARIPRPATTTDVRVFGIDVGGGDIGLDLVPMDARPGARAVDRVQDREELVRFVAVTERGEGH